MLCAAMAATALTACSPVSSDPADDGKPNMLRRAMDADIKSLDPQKVSDLSSLRVASDQFDGLTRFDGNGRAVPALAKGWTVSADGRIWTFTLDTEQRFSDGVPITAHSWVASFDRLRNPATLSPTASLFAPIASVAATDVRTVTVVLATPLPALPELLAHPAAAALPMHRLAALGEGWVSERPLVTSGRYRARRWDLNRAVELEASPAQRNPPPVAHVRWSPIDDPLTGIRAFATGQIDVLSEFPAQRVDNLRARHGAALRNSPSLGTYYFAFNTRRPPFSDARVRRALAILVDRDWIANKIVGAGVTPAEGLVPPSLLPGSTPPYWSSWSKPKRLDEARRLLNAAGYGPDRPLVFDIRFNSSAEHRRVAIALAAMWQPAHVEARLFNSEASLHFAALRRGDFAIARSGWIADYAAPENFLDVHRCAAGPINYSGFCDPAYEKIMKLAHSSAAPDARALLLRKADQYLVGEAPILVLYHYASRNLVSPRVTGWRDNAGNIHPSATLGLRAD
jgi:peptide/nickel transport system substrate-binding protein/oligopeptide transport system substrate-binding protein